MPARGRRPGAHVCGPPGIVSRSGRGTDPPHGVVGPRPHVAAQAARRGPQGTDPALWQGHQGTPGKPRAVRRDGHSEPLHGHEVQGRQPRDGRRGHRIVDCPVVCRSAHVVRHQHLDHAPAAPQSQGFGPRHGGTKAVRVQGRFGTGRRPADELVAQFHARGPPHVPHLYHAPPQGQEEHDRDRERQDPPHSQGRPGGRVPDRVDATRHHLQGRRHV
mmetsp:Transcript_5106/g.12553  ORF Transcript_5106/g.12553 Transcript_5106/m.12553 type:complete len:217 (-) Transcript_5106:492-1142(-)